MGKIKKLLCVPLPSPPSPASPLPTACPPWSSSLSTSSLSTASPTPPLRSTKSDSLSSPRLIKLLRSSTPPRPPVSTATTSSQTTTLTKSQDYLAPRTPPRPLSTRPPSSVPSPTGLPVLTGLKLVPFPALRTRASAAPAGPSPRLVPSSLLTILVPTRPAT